jgi:hypothetical protein
MFGMMISLVLLSLATAGISIVWLLKVKKHLSELGKRVLESEDIGKILQAAEKVGTFESRMSGCESKADESQKRHVEYETKLNELITRQGATEQKMDKNSADLAKTLDQLSAFQEMANRNEAGLTEIIPNIKDLADEVQSLKKFQTAIENTRSLILSAFTDMQVSVPPEEGRELTPEIAGPEQISNGSEDEHQEGEDQNTPETCNSGIEENHGSWRAQ